jgi:hypothetical protein
MQSKNSIAYPPLRSGPPIPRPKKAGLVARLGQIVSVYTKKPPHLSENATVKD